MNGIDLFILIVLGLVVIKGFRKGFVHTLVSLGSIFVAGILCGKVSVMVEPYLVSLFKTSPQIIRLGSLVISFLIVLYAIRLGGKTLNRLMRHTPLMFINRILGAVLSPLVASILMSYIFLFVDQIYPPKITIEKEQTDVRITSRFYNPIKNIVPKYITPDWKKMIKNTTDVSSISK